MMKKQIYKLFCDFGGGGGGGGGGGVFFILLFCYGSGNSVSF